MNGPHPLSVYPSVSVCRCPLRVGQGLAQFACALPGQDVRFCPSEGGECRTMGHIILFFDYLCTNQ